MADNYSTLTGVLVLNKATPVIKALFGPFELDENYPGDGEAYIAKVPEDSNTSWETLHENLQDLSKGLGLAIEDPSDESVEECLHLLATHFKANNDEALNALIEQTDFEDDADLAALFTIALAFDDGHGLKAVKWEESWFCDKPRLFEFGGAGAYHSRHFTYEDCSGNEVAFGETIDQALSSGDTAAGAQAIIRKIRSILAGVNDGAVRDDLLSKVCLGLSAPLVSEPSDTRWFAVSGSIPGTREASCLTFKVKNREDAIAAFEAAMYNGIDQQTRDSNRNAHGEAIFIDSVVASDSTIECL